MATKVRRALRVNAHRWRRARSYGPTRSRRRRRPRRHETKRILPVEELARDERFERIRIEEVVFDPRTANERALVNTLAPSYPSAPDNARALMHGIFVGEIQALEGAGRTCWDFDTGDGSAEA